MRSSHHWYDSVINQSQSTTDAGKLSELSVLHSINETMAAGTCDGLNECGEQPAQ